MALLTPFVSAEAQEAQGTTPPTTTTPQSGTTAPTPNATTAKPAPSESQLPPVQVIQKEQQAPQTAQKKAAPKTAPVATAAPIAPAALPTSVTFGSTIQMSPVGGSEIPLAKVPGGVSTVSSSEISRISTDFAADALQTYVPSVTLSDLQGNVFQPSIDYRGFFASPVDGVPQGLAVYQNGVRINEAFGDTVNLDLIPTSAINGITVLSGNPVFGLNALGGSVTIDMKDGFKYHGFESDTRFGSFSRAQESVQYGAQSGNWAEYIALEDIYDGGYRVEGSSRIRRMYADVGAKGTDSEFHLNFTGADNFVGAAATSPVQLLDEGWSQIFTNPQTTTNVVEMPSINGTVKLSDTLALSGVAYYRHYNQQHVDGNVSNAGPCPFGPGGTPPTGACFTNTDGNTILLHDPNGAVITVPDNLTALGELDRTSLDSNSYGASAQAVDKDKVFGHGNQFLVGGSIDHGTTSWKTNAQLGTFGPGFVVNSDLPFVGATGDVCDAATFAATGACDTTAGGTDLSDIRPVSISTTNTYYGLFFLDTLDVTDRFTFTTGGRFNVARLTIDDNTGLAPGLNSEATYWHFNPSVGGTYKVFPGISLYGGFSEGNRAPVPAELACANPLQPCLLPSFLTNDPPLKQVVSQTWEAGVRGEKTSGTERLNWSVGFFRSLNINDILTVQSEIIGRSSFENAGDLLRQGVEAKIDYRTGRLFTYASYSFVNATFLTPLTLSSPFNPFADANGDIFVQPGDHVPGIPAHTFKTGFDYGLTKEWTFGADFIAVSGQFFQGDESNQNPQLGGYAKVNIHTSYDVNDHIQLYGLVNNLFNAHYGTFGTFFSTDDANGAALGSIVFTDPRAITPALPLAAYGGLKIYF